MNTGYMNRRTLLPIVILCLVAATMVSASAVGVRYGAYLLKGMPEDALEGEKYTEMEVAFFFSSLARDTLLAGVAHEEDDRYVIHDDKLMVTIEGKKADTTHPCRHVIVYESNDKGIWRRLLNNDRDTCHLQKLFDSDWEMVFSEKDGFLFVNIRKKRCGKVGLERSEVSAQFYIKDIESDKA